jgi:UDP-N-acetylmuramate dehydrogenase
MDINSLNSNVVLQENVSLKIYNTFGIDVTSKYFVEVKSLDELQSVLKFSVDSSLSILIVGGGSNILLTKNFDGLVILNSLKGKTVVEQNENQVKVKVASGEGWHDFVMWSLDNNWSGVENLSLIPGSVGAGPMQNIGAYGVELKDVFVELEAVEITTGKVCTFTKEECHFGYRESIFKNVAKNKYFIMSVTFLLNKSDELKTSYGAIKTELEKMNIVHPNSRDVSNAVIAIRQSKLPNPKVLGNAGSFFKNPEIPIENFNKLKAEFPDIIAFTGANGGMKLAAGWLIEQCGWKGKVVGHTGSHKDQALVLVNYGEATGKEIHELALAIRESVKAKFGVDIELEVNIY